ncbi:MAG: sulfatase-like hydrolase/transferase [Chloroflexota bacterium]
MKPNIILIMSDNHSADLLGCYGNNEIHTPHLDKFAQEGMQFNNAFCVNAMCSPCRASVLTGLMPSQHGIHTWIDDRRMEKWPPNWNALSEFETLPEILQTNGYDTAMIGKYHLGSPFEAQNGFDHWVTFPHGHTRSFWGNEVIENGQQSHYEGHIVDFFTEKAVDYIGEREAERPFFLFLPYNAPYGHWPSIKGEAQNRFADLYKNCPMNSVPREGISREMVERFLLTMADSGDGLDYSATLRIPNDMTSLRNYFSQMSLVDDGVGQIMAALQANGLDENTLVIYTCDHGFSLGHHGFWGHGQATWPSNTHASAYKIPLLMREPGKIEAGQQSGNLISQLDLFATLLDYAGLSNAPQTPSRSFEPFLRGEAVAWIDEVFMEQEETRAIRTADWLYMQRFGGAADYPIEDALFDLTADPGERVNLLAGSNKGVKEVVEELNGRLTTYFQQNANSKYDLWHGGTVKSNTSRPWLWPGAWGDDWQPIF